MSDTSLPQKPTLLYPVIVEGRYDKIKLSSLFEGQILTLEGFGIFKNREKKEFFARLAEKTPLIVFTDSDGGGLVLRNHLRGVLPPDRIIHLYIPQVKGKEKRKDAPSREGFLGVEGTDSSFLQKIFSPYLSNRESVPEKQGGLTVAMLYELGYEGGENSKKRRQELLKRCGLPQNLSTRAMLEALNLLYSEKELEKLL